MYRDGRIEVDFATDWDQYSQAWKTSMQHLYWYKESPVFDYNKDEELDEMRSDFGRPGNLFLVARHSRSKELGGVLGLRYKDVMARIRRWEPAVVPEFRNTQTAIALLEKAIEQLTSIGVKRIGYLLKHPIESPEIVEELLTRYGDLGFEYARPDSVDLVMSLINLNRSEAPFGVQLDTGESYTLENLASITVKSSHQVSVINDSYPNNTSS